MTEDLAAILNDLDRLQELLTQPITDEMRADGWTEQGARGMSISLADFANKIRTTGQLPPRRERPWNMARGLDAYGIHGAGPYDDLCAFGRILRDLP